jgi:hypothetical protein
VDSKPGAQIIGDITPPLSFLAHFIQNLQISGNKR